MNDHDKAKLIESEAKMNLAAQNLVELAKRLIPIGTRASFVRRRMDTEYRIYGTVSGHYAAKGGLEISIMSDTGARHTTSLSDFSGFRIED